MDDSQILMEWFEQEKSSGLIDIKLSELDGLSTVDNVSKDIFKILDDEDMLRYKDITGESI